MNEEQHKATADFLLNLIQTACTIPGSAAENLVACKQWLHAISGGTLRVEMSISTGQPPEKEPEADSSDKAA